MKNFFNIANPVFVILFLIVALSIVPATHFVQEKVEDTTYKFAVNVQEKANNVLNIANAKASFDYL